MLDESSNITFTFSWEKTKMLTYYKWSKKSPSLNEELGLTGNNPFYPHNDKHTTARLQLIWIFREAWIIFVIFIYNTKHCTSKRCISKVESLRLFVFQCFTFNLSLTLNGLLARFMKSSHQAVVSSVYIIWHH